MSYKSSTNTTKDKGLTMRWIYFLSHYSSVSYFFPKNFFDNLSMICFQINCVLLLRISQKVSPSALPCNPPQSQSLLIYRNHLLPPLLKLPSKQAETSTHESNVPHRQMISRLPPSSYSLTPRVSNPLPPCLLSAFGSAPLNLVTKCIQYHPWINEQRWFRETVSGFRFSSLSHTWAQT